MQEMLAENFDFLDHENSIIIPEMYGYVTIEWSNSVVFDLLYGTEGKSSISKLIKEKYQNQLLTKKSSEFI